LLERGIVVNAWRVPHGPRADIVHWEKWTLSWDTRWYGRSTPIYDKSHPKKHVPISTVYASNSEISGLGGYSAIGDTSSWRLTDCDLPVPWGLSCPADCIALYGAHHLHFITCSCYRRLPLLGAPGSRDRFLSILERTHERYRFVVVGFVVMPEHVHLLLTKPEIGTPSTVMQLLKQRTACALLPRRKRSDPRQRNLFVGEPQRRAFWQARFYDFNVWTTKKRFEKLRYMHRNPVKRGLVDAPKQWRWSSYRFYLFEEAGPVRVNERWPAISFRNRVA
jgi:putative transposase